MTCPRRGSSTSRWPTFRAEAAGQTSLSPRASSQPMAGRSVGPRLLPSFCAWTRTGRADLLSLSSAALTVILIHGGGALLRKLTELAKEGLCPESLLRLSQPTQPNRADPPSPPLVDSRRPWMQWPSLYRRLDLRAAVRAGQPPARSWPRVRRHRISTGASILLRLVECAPCALPPSRIY